MIRDVYFYVYTKTFREYYTVIYKVHMHVKAIKVYTGQCLKYLFLVMYGMHNIVR